MNTAAGPRSLGATRLLGLLVLAAPAAAGDVVTFTEVSQQAGVATQHQPSFTFLLSPINVASMTSGGAAGDFDRDGDEDLYVITGGAAPDRLYINDGDGTFTDRAGDWGVDYAHMGIGVAVGDYDGDGWLDIYLTSLGPGTGNPVTGAHVLYRNNGNGTFTNVAPALGVHMTSAVTPDGFGAAFGDVDLDGDLDLYTVGWVTQSGANRLFVNNGDGTFSDGTAAAGVGALEMRGFSPMFADMDGDRFPELLVAADFETSRYFVNDGDGTFTDRTAKSGTGLDANGMGHAVADFDGDGRLDWYVTSIFSPASQLPGVPGTGNMLYLNAGDHVFVESSAEMQVKDGGWGWGTVDADIDHDGRKDLVETNGWSQSNGGDPEWIDEPCYVWRNDGRGSFQDIAGQCGLDDPQLGRGLIRLDYDNDGDQDFVVFSYGGGLRLYRNDLAPGAGSFLRLRFDTQPNDRLAPDGYGTRVIARAGGLEQVAALTGGSQYLSQSELSVHMGFGGAASVDELRIEWSSGVVTVWHDVPTSQHLTIAAPSPADLNGDGAVDVDDIIMLLLEWGATGVVPADVDGSGTVDVDDLLALIAGWG